MPARKEVDDWFATYENPMKPVVQRIREIVLAADARIDECIKWHAPTFTYQGNLASFFPRAKKHASLMFHTGATIPGNHPLLLGGAGTSRFLNLATIAEANAAREAIASIVRAWCDLKSNEPAPTTKPAPTKKSPAAKKPGDANKPSPTKKAAPSKKSKAAHPRSR